MTFKIPAHFLGKPVEGSLERALQLGAPITSEAPASIARSLPKIITKNSHQYVYIPQHQGVVIALEETHKGKNMYDTLELLAGEELKVPSIERFMSHRANVKMAAEGNGTLVYADGTPVQKDVAVDLWKYMSSGHKGDCWTWLNARFKEDNQQWFIETDLEVIQDSQGKKFLQGTEGILLPCLREEAYVDLDFNAQGLPIRKAAQQQYNSAQSIYYRNPINDSVARFFADSYWAYLSCSGDPRGSDAALGVLACAEGAASQKAGGAS